MMKTGDPGRATKPCTLPRVRSLEASSRTEPGMVWLSPHELLRKLSKQLEFLWLEATEKLATGDLSIRQPLSRVTGNLEGIGINQSWVGLYSGSGTASNTPGLPLFPLCQAWQGSFHL